VELTQMEQNIISFYEGYEYQFVDKAGGQMVFIDVSGCPFSLDYVFSVAAGTFEPIGSLPELVQKKVMAAMAKRDRNKEEQ
jgi:hypothetical protein